MKVFLKNYLKTGEEVASDVRIPGARRREGSLLSNINPTLFGLLCRPSKERNLASIILISISALLFTLGTECTYTE